MCTILKSEHLNEDFRVKQVLQWQIFYPSITSLLMHLEAEIVSEMIQQLRYPKNDKVPKKDLGVEVLNKL
jgi:hypothetical protein